MSAVSVLLCVYSNMSALLWWLYFYLLLLSWALKVIVSSPSVVFLLFSLSSQLLCFEPLYCFIKFYYPIAIYLVIIFSILVATCYCEDFFLPYICPVLSLLLSCILSLYRACAGGLFILIPKWSTLFLDFGGGSCWGGDDQFQPSRNYPWFRENLIVTRLCDLF